MATRIPYEFATSGDTTEVPDESSTDELSWQDGWSDAYALDTDESGYRYIDRSEMNYLFNVLSANIKEWQEQVFPAYSDEISYPEGAVILYTDDVFYEATTTTTAASVPGVSDDWVEYTRSGELSALISANTTSIETNATNIATNTTSIDANTSDIATLQTTVTKKFTSSAQTISSGGLITVSHGLTDENGDDVKPFGVGVYAICTTDDAGFVVGDTAPLTMINNSGSSDARRNSVKVTTTEIYLRMSTNSNVFIVGNFGTGEIDAVTNSYWDLYITAWY